MSSLLGGLSSAVDWLSVQLEYLSINQFKIFLAFYIANVRDISLSSTWYYIILARWQTRSQACRAKSHISHSSHFVWRSFQPSNPKPGDVLYFWLVIVLILASFYLRIQAHLLHQFRIIWPYNQCLHWTESDNTPLREGILSMIAGYVLRLNVRCCVDDGLMFPRLIENGGRSSNQLPRTEGVTSSGCRSLIV